jgi:ParB family transcriptional regulator, chromosome partitioning protein
MSVVQNTQDQATAQDTAGAAEPPVTRDQTDAAEPSAPTIVQVDPRTLIVEANVRSDAALTPAFVGSIRTHGVLTPVLVHRTAEGLRVRAGQRRTLASIEAGRDTIPAYVIDGDDDTARRIIEQMVENDHRAALADHDRVTGFQQLSLLGLSAATIAKRAGVKKATVTTALTVAASEVATAVAAKYDLTLDQAAVIAEFDGDDETVKDLTVCAVKDPGRFDHLAQQYRDRRAEQAAYDAAVADLAAHGIPVVDRPAYGEKSATVRITDLATVDAEGNKTLLDAEGHAACPARAAWVTRNWEGLHIVHVCTAPTEHGHVARYEYAQGALNPTTGGKMTDEQKAERRTIVANNKAWKSAEKVRRTWLASFAARKTAPKDAPQFIAARMVDSLGLIEKAATQTSHRLARTWLGLPEHQGYGTPNDLAALIANATPARAQHITLVLVLAGIEANTDTHTWRRQSGVHRAYLTALAAWGYNLADVEALVTAERPTDAPEAETDRDDADDDGDEDAAYDSEGYDDGDGYGDDEPTH